MICEAWWRMASAVFNGNIRDHAAAVEVSEWEMVSVDVHELEWCFKPAGRAHEIV
jgi:hypothetical protein